MARLWYLYYIWRISPDRVFTGTTACLPVYLCESREGGEENQNIRRKHEPGIEAADGIFLFRTAPWT